MHMHVHAAVMRTTIEIDERQRGELLRIAATRGEKGFSAVIREAVDYFLTHHTGREDAVRAALGVKGALSESEADALAAEVQKVRESWR